MKQLQVICTNSKNYNITENKIYNVLTEEDLNYILTNDNNKVQTYSKKLFKIVEDEVEIIPVPIPPARPARTEEQVITSIKICKTGEDRNVRYLLQYRNINNENIEICDILEDIDSEKAYNSCGIQNIENIQTLFSTISDFTENNYEGESLTKFQNALFECILNELCDSQDWLSRTADQTKVQAAMFTISITDCDENEDFYQILSSKADSETNWLENPNTGNNIKMWIFSFN